MPRASATCAGVALLTPRWRISPCLCSSASAVKGASIDPFGRPVVASHDDPQIDDVERRDAEVPQVVVDRAREVGRGERRVPRGIVAAHGADLGHDHQPVGIGMERLVDELVGDVGAVEIAGVDVIDAPRHRLAQHGERTLAIPRRTEDTRPRELHRAIAQAFHGSVAETEGVEGGGSGHEKSPVGGRRYMDLASVSDNPAQSRQAVRNTEQWR